MCGDIFNNHFITSFLQNVPVKNFAIWRKYGQSLRLTFLGHPVYISRCRKWTWIFNGMGTIQVQQNQTPLTWQAVPPGLQQTRTRSRLMTARTSDQVDLEEPKDKSMSLYWSGRWPSWRGNLTTWWWRYLHLGNRTLLQLLLQLTQQCCVIAHHEQQRCRK